MAANQHRYRVHLVWTGGQGRHHSEITFGITCSVREISHPSAAHRMLFFGAMLLAGIPKTYSSPRSLPVISFGISAFAPNPVLS
jgi:hypothetical protein